MLKWIPLAVTGLALCIVACGSDDTSAQGASGSGASGSGASGSTSQGGGTTSDVGGSSGQGGDVGRGGAGEGGGASAKRECNNVTDCALDNDCCNCAGVPTGTDLPCDINSCLVPTCTEHEANQAVAEQCRLGRCVTTIDCDLTQVLCKQAEPDCGPGKTPSYNGMGCYGPCAVTTECASVGDCGRCGPNEACVAEVAQTGPVFHCIAMPDGCNGVASCDCMGASVCDTTFDVCNDADTYLACVCSSC